MDTNSHVAIIALVTFSHKEFKKQLSLQFITHLLNEWRSR